MSDSGITVQNFLPSLPLIGKFFEAHQVNTTYVSFTGEVIAQESLPAVREAVMGTLEYLGIREKEKSWPAPLQACASLALKTFSNSIYYGKKAIEIFFSVFGWEIFSQPEPKTYFQVASENLAAVARLTQKPYHWLVDRAVELGIPGASFAKRHPYLTQGGLLSLAGGGAWLRKRHKISTSTLETSLKITTLETSQESNTFETSQESSTFEASQESNTFETSQETTALETFFSGCKFARGTLPAHAIRTLKEKMCANSQLMKQITMQDGVPLLDDISTNTIVKSNGELMFSGPDGTLRSLNLLLKKLGLERWETSYVRMALYELLHENAFSNS